ncbi:MAG: hypothetical protein JRI66_11245 [Deltaproteobacteria bacterium]|nr:hypothetical protein [Deltaproteobacteria bacterium]
MVKLEQEWQGTLRLTVNQTGTKTFYIALAFEADSGQTYEATGRGRTVIAAMADAAKTMPGGFLGRLLRECLGQLGGMVEETLEVETVEVKEGQE